MMRSVTARFVGAVVLLPALASSALLDFQLINGTTAKCNDGSDPAVYFKAGANPDSPWLIGLESGGQCHNYDSCKGRRDKAFHLTSSTTRESQRWFNGHYSDDESVSYMHDFHKVYVVYCTSDGWHGDQPIDPFDGTLSGMTQFQGARLVTEVVAALQAGQVNPALPKLDSNSKVVWSGYSAGARGTMVNADRLAKILHNARFILDSGYYVVTEAGSSLVPETQGVFELFVKDTALANSTENNVNSWEDLFGEYRMPQLTSTYLMITSSYDTYQNHAWSGGDDYPETTVAACTNLNALDANSFIYCGNEEVHAVGADSWWLLNRAPNQLELANEFVREHITEVTPSEVIEAKYCSRKYVAALADQDPVPMCVAAIIAVDEGVAEAPIFFRAYSGDAPYITVVGGGSARHGYSGQPFEVAAGSSYDVDLFHPHRYAESAFFYTVPVMKNEGAYKVSIGFAEDWDVACKYSKVRVFDVMVNDEAFLNEYEPAVAAGGCRKGVVESGFFYAKDGILKILFRKISGRNNPMLSFVEILPA